MKITDIDTFDVTHVSSAIRLRRLWGEPGGPRLLLVEFDAGAKWPGLDVHEPGEELVLVERGELIDGAHTLGTGTFAEYPPGSSHSPMAGPSGCRLLVFYPRG